MDKIQELKKSLTEQSDDYKSLLRCYHAARRSLQDLIEQFDRLEGDDDQLDGLRSKIEVALKLYEFAKADLASEFDISVLDYEGNAYKEHTPQPVSCFSLPQDFLGENTLFWFENYIYKKFGYKVAFNKNTKDHYLRNEKFLFLKVDLTYPEQVIEDEVGRMVRHAKALLGRASTARKAHIQDLFDNIFPEIALSKNRDNALEDTSSLLKAICGENIDSESLRKRYYEPWKKKHGVNDLRRWRKQKKGNK